MRLDCLVLPRRDLHFVGCLYLLFICVSLVLRTTLSVIEFLLYSFINLFLFLYILFFPLFSYVIWPLGHDMRCNKLLLLLLHGLTD